MTQISDLRKIIQDWGTWFAAQYDTRCKWVDLYAENPDMKGYPTRRLTVKVGPAVLNMVPTQALPSIAFEDERHNNTDIETLSTFSFNEETTSTFSWSLTESIDVGTRASVSAPLPAGFKADLETSVNIGLSSTQQQEDSTTRYWAREEQVSVPPRTLIKAKMVIMQEKYDMDFVADVTLSGYVAIWLQDKRDVNNKNGSDLHWLWFIPVSSVFRDRPVDGYHVISGGTVQFQSRGRFVGVQGFKCIIQYEQFSLAPSADGAPPQAPTKTWEELVEGYGIVPADAF
ncbi:ETX/MTX2 family pore-forming toxin [Massilia sp. YIM B02763]|uniref:ETX/MTX2 family pore-forming toxin n=1 Tax=Massilia sp. YIM B02763 TaxID=3050130 RepID=UPI0025B68509|nr:ETX/MTX2 family pore-forming toxin [Massilia sp. YIM B02763]MDN4055635.1 ETX/MTX2 family pore-forming toxin [Massilia sp. YIM B02763]